MVQGGFSVEHHPPEVGRQLSRARRESHRTAIVESGGRRWAEVIAPIESIAWEGRTSVRLRDFTRWLGPVGAYRSAEMRSAPSGAAMVVDPFVFALHLGAGDASCEVVGTHDGDEFRDLAVGSPVAVYVTSGVDVRRAKLADLESAAASGSMLGGWVDTFAVHVV